MSGKDEIDPPEQSAGSWDVAGFILHDVETTRIAMYSAIVSMERELDRKGVRLADDPFKFIYGCMDEMQFTLHAYALISNPESRLSIVPSRITLTELLHSIARSVMHRTHSQEARPRIIVNGGECITTLRLDKRLFQLALRCLLSGRVAAFENPAQSLIDVICRSTQDKILLDIHYRGTLVDESSRNHLFELDTARTKGASKLIRMRSGLELEFIRQVVIAHGGQLHVTDNPYTGIVVTIHLPKLLQRED